MEQTIFQLENAVDRKHWWVCCWLNIESQHISKAQLRVFVKLKATLCITHIVIWCEVACLNWLFNKDGKHYDVIICSLRVFFTWMFGRYMHKHKTKILITGGDWILGPIQLQYSIFKFQLKKALESLENNFLSSLLDVRLLEMLQLPDAFEVYYLLSLRQVCRGWGLLATKRPDDKLFIFCNCVHFQSYSIFV